MTSPQLGSLFENLVIVEAMKARFNRGEEPNLYFFRDNNGLEVDLLTSDGANLTPIEIKASMTFSPDFVKSIARLRKTSDKISTGYVVYAGELETEFQETGIVNFANTERAIVGPPSISPNLDS